MNPAPAWRGAAAAVLMMVATLSRGDITEPPTPRPGDAVTVTARGIPAPISRTPGGVAVVTAADLAERAPVDVAGALAATPGVARAGDGPWGGDINIRGLTRESVVLLIDGNRVNTGADIGARTGTIDPVDVERVEILKGPISALYGSGALGGVVNVLSRSPRFRDDPAWVGRLVSGVSANPDGLRLHGAAGYHAPDAYLALSQSWRKAGTYADGDGLEVRNSRYRDRLSRMQAGWRPTRHWTVDLNVQFHEGNAIGIPGSGTAPLPAAADVTYAAVRRGLGAATVAWTPPGGLLERSALRLYRQTVDRRVVLDNFPDAAPVERVTPGADHVTDGVAWINVAAWGAHRIVGGIDVWERSLTSFRTRYLRSGAVIDEDPLPRAAYRSAGCYIEDAWRAGRDLTLNAGGRIDAIRVTNETGSNWDAGTFHDTGWNAHLGATWAADERLAVKAIAASGYRAASLEERYQVLDLGGGMVVRGDPNLDPERSRFGETGIVWGDAVLDASLSAFWNELTDLIGRVREDDATIRNANIDRARILGAEAALTWQATRGVRGYGNLSWARGRDTAKREALLGVPPLTGLAGVRVGAGRGWLAGETEFAAAQTAVPDGTDPTPGWAIVNVRAGLALPWNAARLRLQIRNLFDSAYRDHLTSIRGQAFNEPGRNLTLSFEQTF